MRRKPLNKNARTQSALLASSEIRWGSRASKQCGAAEAAPARNVTSQFKPLSRPDRNGNHGIKFISCGFGDKILKFYLLKYNKRSVLSKRRSIKF